MKKMDSVLRDKLSMIAALGAGVVVGLSGIYLYYKINRKVTRELSHLSGTIESLKKEIRDLKRNRYNNMQIKNPSYFQSQSHTIASGSSGEEGEEEYFDFTDSEEVINSWTTANGSSIDEITKWNKDHDWLTDIDKQLDGNSTQKDDAYYILLEKQKKHSKNAEVLWRLTKAIHLQGIMAQKREELEKKKELSFQAFHVAKQALQQDDSNPEVHKWYAIAVGSLAEYVGIQEKIQNGYTFKKHVDEAIRLKESDPTLHHMLGRWCYEVAMLTWIERKLASTLFTNPPNSTLLESRNHLLKAENLKPDWKENILFIAKCFVEEGDYSSAITWIDKAIDLPCNDEEDELVQNELEIMQYKYKGYRQ